MKLIRILLIICLVNCIIFVDLNLLHGAEFMDHEIFDKLLQKHVKNGAIDYAGFLKDSNEFDKYLNTLAHINLSKANNNQLLAFYINAYNAFTIKLILENYGKIKSIRDISKPWKQKKWIVSEKKISLDEIEHEILRKKLKNARIHFAIVCASIGCPDIHNKAYTEKNIHEELKLAAEKFINSEKHVKFETSVGYLWTSEYLRVSKIFSWFSIDFEKDSGSVLNFIEKYAKDDLKDFIQKKKKNISLKYLSYDWKLNELKK